MAIKVITKYPNLLIKHIKDAIVDDKVRTWAVDSDGDFTHTPDQWQKHAWLRPYFLEESVIFGIIRRKGIPISTEDYAVYHGRFAEMLLAHFDDDFTEINITSLPTEYDTI